MGLFSREEKMNMETGKFETTKRGLFHRDSRTPVSDKLLAQAKQEKRVKRLERKKELKEAFEEAKYKAQLSRMKREGARSGSMSVGDRVSNLASGFSMLPSSNNFNPFGSRFDSGLGKSVRHKSSKGTGKKYAIVGGKAYPIANTKSSGKKKKTGKRKSTMGMGGFDMMDNWGFMK